MEKRKELALMADNSLLKRANPEKPEVSRFPGLFETPLFGGNLFAVNPFTLMRRFTDEMDRVFGAAPNKTGALPNVWAPAIEVKEKDGKFFLTADLPGLNKDEVKVHVDGETLVIEGERKKEKEEKSEGFYHSERSYGSFYRSIPLPEGAKTDLITALFTNGVLEVAIPVPEAKSKRKDVPILEPAAKPKAA
jgi:HSP20 family protein